jgi:hypothetical protein
VRTRTSIVLGLTAWLLTLWPAFAQGQSNVLQAIPGDAIGFAVLNNLEQASGKIQKLGTKAKIPVLLPPLQLLKLSLGIQKGLDEKGTAALVVLPGDPPQGVALVPVTDYKDFIGSFKAKDIGDKISEIQIAKKTAWVGEKSGFAVIAFKEEEKDAIKKVLNSTTSVAASVKEVEGWLSRHDVAGVITPSGLKQIIAKVREGLDQAKAITANLPQEIQFVTTMVEGVDNFFKSAETEVTHIAFGGRVDAAVNLELSARAVFAKGGNFSQAAGKVMAPSDGPLAGLPSGPYVIAAGGALPKKMMAEMSRFSLEVLKVVLKDLSEEQNKKLEQIYTQSLKGMQAMAMELRLGKPGQPLLENIVYGITVDDAPAYLKLYEQNVRVMNELVKDGKIPFQQPVELKKVKVGESTAFEVTNDMSGNPGLNAIPQEVMELLFGKEAKMTTTMTAAGKTTLLARYSPAEGLKRILAKSKPGLSADAGTVKTSLLLPEGHQWALYINPQGVVETLKRVKTALGEQSELPAFPETPPVGAAIRISSDGLDARLAVPAEVIQGFGTLVPHILKKLRGAGGEGQ